MKTVVIVHLARPNSMGEVHRVRTWIELARDLGHRVHTVPLRPAHLVSVRNPPGAGQWRSVARREAVPESLSWSLSSTRAALQRLSPTTAICITTRAFHPALWPGAVVLDFVDRLSVSYGDRAAIVGRRSPTGMALGLLARCQQPLEARPPTPATAAGWGDAEALGVDWLPITMESKASTRPSRTTRYDLLFFGNLSYAPNVEAVEHLATLFDTYLHPRRPRVLIAGARPARRVRAVTQKQGWDLRSDFPSVSEIVKEARLAVVPLRHAAGIQIKVLEAAAHGVPQVLSAAAAKGLDPLFPAAVAATDAAFASAIMELLDDRQKADCLGAAAREHLSMHYSRETWRGLAADLFGRAASAPPTRS